MTNTLLRRMAPALAALLASFAAAQTRTAPTTAELTDLTLEQLTNIEVTSVSRRAERLSAAAGSVYVITADDIRSSGATSIAEVLRLAPNLHVARADANQYAISARGFNSTTANKMLTLIDGRTVYSPLFSGVFWEAQDVMLEDVERIEVMSGSGGTVWGSNAVNGFINIVTRSAGDTQGTLASVGGGNRERLVSVRYGGAMPGGGHYRIYGKLAGRSPTSTATGTPIRDASERTQTGLRADWGTASGNFTLQGDVYTSDIDQGAAPAQRRIAGLNLLGRMTRTLDDGSSLRLQAYYDRTERDQPGAVRDALDTFAVEFQHAPQARGSHTPLWGGGYRYQADRLANLGPALAFLPARRTQALANLFLQDELALRQDLGLTLGRSSNATVTPDGSICRTCAWPGGWHRSNCCGARYRVPCVFPRASTGSCSVPQRHRSSCWPADPVSTPKPPGSWSSATAHSPRPPSPIPSPCSTMCSTGFDHWSPHPQARSSRTGSKDTRRASRPGASSRPPAGGASARA